MTSGVPSGAPKLPRCMAAGCTNASDPRWGIHGPDGARLPACDACGTTCEGNPCTCPPADLDDIVDRWHEDPDDARPLHVALGMSWETYVHWAGGRAKAAQDPAAAELARARAQCDRLQVMIYDLGADLDRGCGRVRPEAIVTEAGRLAALLARSDLLACQGAAPRDEPDDGGEHG